MWSKELTELSRENFESGFCNVKNKVPEFGELTREGDRFKITLFSSGIELIYGSVEEIINAGWAVD
jgi:hypothetical protein